MTAKVVPTQPRSSASPYTTKAMFNPTGLPCSVDPTGKHSHALKPIAVFNFPRLLRNFLHVVLVKRYQLKMFCLHMLLHSARSYSWLLSFNILGRIEMLKWRPAAFLPWCRHLVMEDLLRHLFSRLSILRCLILDGLQCLHIRATFPLRH